MIRSLSGPDLLNLKHASSPPCLSNVPGALPWRPLSFFSSTPVRMPVNLTGTCVSDGNLKDSSKGERSGGSEIELPLASLRRFAPHSSFSPILSRCRLGQGLREQAKPPMRGVSVRS